MKEKELQKLKTKIEIKFIDNLQDIINERYKLINSNCKSKNEKESRMYELKSLNGLLQMMKLQKTIEITIKS